jgi:hypothetical protein
MLLMLMNGLRKRLTSGWATSRYEWFLYTIKGGKRCKKVADLSKKIGVDITEPIKSELWARGLSGERGIAEMGKGMRARVKKALEGSEAEPRILTPVAQRQDKGRKQLEEAAILLGFLTIENEYGLIMLNRNLGIMIMTGYGWAYVYKTGHRFSFTDNMIQIGYFQMWGGNMEEKLMNAINGEMKDRVAEHSNKNRAYKSRRLRANERLRTKRKTAE